MGFKLGEIFKTDEESLIIDRKKQAIKALIIFTVIVVIALAGLIALQNIGDVDEKRRVAITIDIQNIQNYVKNKASEAEKTANYTFPGLDLNRSGDESAIKLNINGFEEEYRYGYYLLRPEDYKEDMSAALNVENEVYIVNYTTADVINYEGIKYENGRYHSVDDLVAIASIKEGNNVQIPSRNTIIIKTSADMDKLHQNPNANFKLAANIDMTPYKTGQGWKPVESFTGNFDGRGYTISNLTIARQTQGYVGLFGNINGGIIRNLTLEKVDIDGENYTGALAGTNHGQVSNVIVEGGNIRGKDYVGGVVGANQGNITMCKVNIERISGNNNVGGVVGLFNSGIVEKCVALLDSISASTGVGGLIGKAAATNISDLRECMSSIQTKNSKVETRTGGISGKTDVGGLVGSVEIMNTYKLTIRDCYSLGNINEGKDNVGGLLGRLHVGAQGLFEISTSYAAMSILEKGLTAGGCIGLLDASIGSDPSANYVVWEKNLAPGEVLNDIGKSETSARIAFSSKSVSEMMTRLTYTGWNFDVWDIKDYSSRPFLKFENTFIRYDK